MDSPKKNRGPLSAAISVLMMLSLFFSVQAFELAVANPAGPPPNTVWNIVQPQNTSYSTNYVSLNFTVTTNLGLLYYYSLDDGEKQEIVTKTIAKVPLSEYPPFMDGTLWTRRTLQSTTIQLPYLTKGNHTLIIYQIFPRSVEEPEKGNVISQATVTFSITSDSLKGNTTPSPSPQQSASTNTPDKNVAENYALNVFVVLVIIAVIGLASAAIFLIHKKEQTQKLRQLRSALHPAAC